MHTMSKAIYNQNIFYTSDSELQLKFELIEKEYSYDSGEILLFNETDKSFVTRGISKVDGGFVYQIDDDIIRHYGEWTGQLQLVKNGEVYTSKPFQFTIENDLSSVSPPQLIDINSWATLKQSAIDLIDDMQNVIGEYDKAAIDFQQSENNRIDNEKDRIQAESTRQNHETTRQNQERERESNEDERKANEAARQVNETTRQANESGRQQAEQGRVSAEDIRIENEEQRKIDHANRSAELDGKANKKQEDWITPTLLNGFKGVAHDTIPQFYKNSLGEVLIHGYVNGGQIDQAVFILPEGYRPKRHLYISCTNGASWVWVQILSNGVVRAKSSTLTMDGIIFKAER